MYDNKVYEVKKENVELTVGTDKSGHILLPPEVAKMLGMADGANLRIILHRDRIEVFPNIHSLARVYIEPTSRCNLKCETCIRNTWKEPMGDMDIQVFDKLMDQLKEFNELQSVMFGGFGEPTANRDILYMIGRAKSLGVEVEMTTNGTLLDDKMLEGLMDKKLDMLWVSFDGTSESNFEDVREGASFNSVVENLKSLKRLNRKSNHRIKVGIAFVVMKKNINDLGNINVLAKSVGATKISISNVLPYSREMADQMLCDLTVTEGNIHYLPDSITVSLPLIDRKEITKEPLYRLLVNNKNISVMTNRIGAETSKCRFIKERCTFIRWDGMVCPCMGLLHSYKTYLNSNNLEREILSYALGDINSKSLKNIWDSQEYHDFREKVDMFDFSPCYSCGGCDFAEKNHEDCFGNKFPTCGGCLWAQGVIQCP